MTVSELIQAAVDGDPVARAFLNEAIWNYVEERTYADEGDESALEQLVLDTKAGLIAESARGELGAEGVGE